MLDVYAKSSTDLSSATHIRYVRTLRAGLGNASLLTPQPADFIAPKRPQWYSALTHYAAWHRKQGYKVHPSWFPKSAALCQQLDLLLYHDSNKPQELKTWYTQLLICYLVYVSPDLNAFLSLQTKHIKTLSVPAQYRWLLQPPVRLPQARLADNYPLSVTQVYQLFRVYSKARLGGAVSFKELLNTYVLI